MDKRNYLKEFIWLWVKAVILYIISGYIFGMNGASFGNLILPTAMFGLTFFNKVVKFNLFGNHDAVLIFWILKIGLSIMIGIIAFPIVNVYYIIMIIRTSTVKIKETGTEV